MDQKEIKPDERHELKTDGACQILTIRDVQLGEEAEYTVRVGPKGPSTTAPLWVEGTPHLHTQSYIKLQNKGVCL